MPLRQIPLIALALVLMLVPAGAANAAVTVKAQPAKPRATSLVTFSGRAGGKAGKKVSVQRRSGKKWTSIAKGRTGKRGTFALTWVTPAKKAKVQVRALLGRTASKAKRLTIRPRKKGAPRVRVSKKTRIIAPSAVQSVPTPGEPGKVTYAGGNDIEKGAIVVVGKGPDTPAGFLGRVVDVDQGNGKTFAQTVPATLIQAVPEGSTHLVADKVTARTYTRAAKITCEGSAGFSITPDVSFTAGLDFAGAWGSGIFDGPESASVTASASFTASVEAAVAASGSCALAKRSLLSVKGPSVTGFVGPVPIVLTSNLTIYFDASAGVQGGVSTSASAGFDASAGVAWTKAGGFTSTQSFEPRFSFEPPTLSASANVAAHLTPTVDVLLYGIGGPRVALQTGIEFDADTTKDPWWELTVPVRLTGSLAIPALDLESPQLDIYSRSFPLADAGAAFGQPTPPPPPPVHNEASPLTSLAVGYGHSCAVRADGTVACWGRDNLNQLGNGAAGASNVPVPVTGITDATAIAAGQDHACALRADGSIKCWGSNAAGELGNGTKTASNVPVVVKGVPNAIAVTAGVEHSCALLNTGRVRCWGGNGEHELGDGSTSPSPDPTFEEVKNLRDVVSIGGTFRTTCAVVKTGAVYCWGRNDMGMYGNGTTTPSAVPVQVSNLTDAVLVTGGIAHMCALRADETVSCWGSNGQGQIGFSSGASYLTPASVQGTANSTAIGTGHVHSCAVAAAGTIKCWGSDQYGQLGDGAAGGNRPPDGVANITDAKGVAGSSGHTCALRATGAIACWGFGGDGELGNGANKDSATPVNVVGFPAT